MSEILKNIYISYSTEPTYFILTVYGILMICSGVFNIKIIMKLFTKLDLYDLPDIVWRGMIVGFGVIFTAVTVIGASKIW